MRESVARATERRAWRTMRCGQSLQRDLPRGAAVPGHGFGLPEEIRVLRLEAERVQLNANGRMRSPRASGA